MANGRGGGQNYSYGYNSANNKQAQLATAYQELTKELGSEKLKIVGGYTIGRVIGEGTYGSVHLATHRLTGTRCAIKKIPKSATSHLTREIHHHRSLHHPSIVHLHEIIATESHIWLVTELCSGGELFDYLVERGRMLEGEARKLFGELAVAVGWMHRQGVVHRDLKLENVLLDGELRIKLGDLGFAREWQRGRLMETFCGTTGYASPEMLAGRRYLGVETDIWSMGIILYVLLCGGLPFDDDDERVMKDLIAKGEYEEPEWLSDEARSLIRGMLQQDPTQRLTIDAVLTHPWFKMTIVDKIRDAPGEKSAPTSPIIPGSGQRQDDYFSEPFKGTANAVAGPSRLVPPYVATPSPLSSHVATVPQPESDASETSLDQGDSEHGKTSSGITTPPTTTEGDDGAELISRQNSGEYSATEKALEMLHPNSSQSTIRRSGSDSPGSGSGSGPSSSYKNRVAMRTSLGGQVLEEDETEDGEGPFSHPSNEEDLSLHLPVANHHRTPSRTKRRSVSSTLSLERRHSHHSMSGQWQTYYPDDYLAKLNEERPIPFTSPSEKHLLGQLNDMGFDVGQMRHSVESNACDSSAATWWILRIKQLERGETDDVITSRLASEARKRERAAAYAREERRKAREEGSEQKSQSDHRSAAAGVAFIDEPTAIPVTPSFNVIDLGAPIVSPSVETTGGGTGLALTNPIEAINFGSVPPIELKPPAGMISPAPRTPPRVNTRELASPDGSDKDRDRDRSKPRSPSMNMLQRATSVWVGGSKRSDVGSEAHDSPATQSNKDEKEKRGPSPTKLHKAPPKAKMPRSESENGLISALTSRPLLTPIASGESTPNVGSPQQEKVALGKSRLVTSTSVTSGLGEESPAGSVRSVTADALAGAGSNRSSKLPKRDSLWTTFRHLFNEERRRRKSKELEAFSSGNRIGSGSGVTGEVKVGPSVVLARGPNARAHAHPSRIVMSGTPGSRRTSLDGRPAMHSRRSSSVNSRRSSFNSIHFNDHSHSTTQNTDLLPGLNRRTSGRSHGSQTPTSDREYIDRPASSHSMRRGGPGGPGGSRSRRSSMSVKSPSLRSETSGRFASTSHGHGHGPGAPPSPLLNHRRRAPGGNDSTRVRHIRVIPETQVLRSSSVASSIRSNVSAASSRASSVERRDRESEYESGKDDSASSRSHGYNHGHGHGQSRRQHLSSLAEQIHRNRSPLSHQQQQGGTKKPLRDVFHNKTKNIDDEWISEDEDDEFAGGLGQSASNAHTHGTTTGGGSGTMWLHGNRAAAFPGTGRGSNATVSARKERGRGRNSPKDEQQSIGAGAEKKEGGGLDNIPSGGNSTTAAAAGGGGGGGGGGGRQRRGIASGRAAPPIQEEEEDEE